MSWVLMICVVGLTAGVFMLCWAKTDQAMATADYMWELAKVARASRQDSERMRAMMKVQALHGAAQSVRSRPPATAPGPEVKF